MTISLSNQNSNRNVKVISLKKLSDIQKSQNDSTTTNIEEHTIKLENEMTELEQSLKDLEQKKEKMLTDIKEAIEKEKTIWLETKEKERQEAKDTGYKIGYDEGLEKAEQVWANKIKEANQITEMSNQDYYRTVEKHEDAILQLSIATAEKVIQNKLNEDKSYFITIIKQAIEELRDKSNIVIYVHPNRYSILIDQKAELEQLLEKEDLLTVYMDKQLEENDCTIKHPFGQVDVGIDVQLQQIKDILAERLREES